MRDIDNFNDEAYEHIHISWRLPNWFVNDNIAKVADQGIYVFTVPDSLYLDTCIKFKDVKIERIFIDNRTTGRKNQDLEDYH